MSSIVPPLPVGIALSTSRQRQSRNHDGRSLRISATCNELYHIKILYNRNAEIRGDGKRTSSIGRKIPLWALDSQTAGSCCYPTTVAGNSNDSNRIRTRLHVINTKVTFWNRNKSDAEQCTYACMLPHIKMHNYISLKKDLRGLTFIPII